MLGRDKGDTGAIRDKGDRRDECDTGEGLEEELGECLEVLGGDG